ncbi:bifunctional 5,10-methylenetetrahydrofolate dehydrogenase/5,10-methenyltetrahydrofolate cyclohydrolase [Cohnella yongneupensis]|uniref:Bifunctional protein FolD n=1 Tax=Cohnella yongneupensis TaxID=425006 RepID=A0ABW0QZL0_9BACL
MSEQVTILDGVAVARNMRSELQTRVEELAKQGITPCLATILVGDDPASATYVRMKGNACERLGIRSKRVTLPSATTTEELLRVIGELNDDPLVHGILLQHPVPEHIDEREAFERIKLGKDVDGVTTLGFGRTAFDLPSYAPCTPQAILSILDAYEVPLEGKHAVVIGRSPILGKPVSLMLLNRNATVTICHSKTQHLASIVKTADIVVAAVGKPRFVQGSWIKQGAVVLDAGYNPGNVGDVDYEACLPHVSAITPVPGGIGPVTIATLLRNTVHAAESELNR